MNIKNRVLAAAGAVVVLLDQFAKQLVVKNLSSSDSIHAIPGLFDFVYVKNTGAAFSILSNSTLLLGIISVLFCICAAVYWYVKKPAHVLMRTSLALLISGAFGNAVDRLFRGYVVDFIQTAFIKFPVFNVADIAITFGAVLLCVYLIFFDKGSVNDAIDTDGGKSE